LYFPVYRYLKQFAKLRLELTDKLFSLYNCEVFGNKVSNLVLIHCTSILSYFALTVQVITKLQRVKFYASDQSWCKLFSISLWSTVSWCLSMYIQPIGSSVLFLLEIAWTVSLVDYVDWVFTDIWCFRTVVYSAMFSGVFLLILNQVLMCWQYSGDMVIGDAVSDILSDFKLNAS